MRVLDTCFEVLRTYRGGRGFDADARFRYAKICRVANVMRPYIEAVLSRDERSAVFPRPFGNACSMSPSIRAVLFKRCSSTTP